jgi:hypothetical protein
MKKPFYITLLCLVMSHYSFSQGRVVINEFMPWTSNTCGGPTAEFVELLNFGPGPVNIGCYILTDGDFAITIPSNTILQPGEFYVISGQTVIPGPCANIDSTITANLNWNTCNCTSGPIPTTGDGLFTDGGSASEQVVLLDPNLNLVDAVIRTLPFEPSSLITTSTVAGQCTAKSFDLDLMSINYETIGESAGRGNSFARKLDGDCGWVKDPQQSADATNNTPSEQSDSDYDFAVTAAMDCSGNGSIEIAVNTPNPGTFFPVTYTLAYDNDHDNLFESSDTYTQGVDNSPSVVQVNGLVAGNYRITLASALGCNLHTFPFTIIPCGPILPVHLISFTASQYAGVNTCHWAIENSDDLQKVILEKSQDGRNFVVEKIFPVPPGGVWNSGHSFAETGGYHFIRLRMVARTQTDRFSPVIDVMPKGKAILKAWPNPATDNLTIQLNADKNQTIFYSVVTSLNQRVQEGNKFLYEGINLISIATAGLQPGSYFLVINVSGKNQVLPFFKL